MPNASERISPTAYATGAMWVRLGLSHPALSTPRGKRLDRAFSFAIQPSRLFGGAAPFDTLMLARHKGIDTLLEQAIESGRVTQVIEIAAGLSGRGWRMMQKYGDRLTYLEADLPHMAALKRRMLEDGGLLPAGKQTRHRVLEIDALSDAGPMSLAAIGESLDQTQGLAIITEGLLSYLDPANAEALWRRIADVMRHFAHGLHLSDAYITSENRGASAKFVRSILQRFVSGKLHIHYSSGEDAVNKMQAAGFSQVALHAPRDLAATADLGRKRGGDRVRVLEAWTAQ